jgi:predicted transcriptional regulator
MRVARETPKQKKADQLKMTENEKAELSKYCKTNCGLDAKEVADLAQVPRRTFYDWWSGRRRAVELIVLGIKAEREQNK